MHRMTEVLLWLSAVQAVRPTHHWWPRPRGLAWFRVLMIVSLVKRPASAGLLSRIGDYLFAARGPGLFLRIRRRTTFPHKHAVTRGPPHPLFHRRCSALIPRLRSSSPVCGSKEHYPSPRSSIDHTDWWTSRPKASWPAISKFVGVTQRCWAAVRTSRRQRSKPVLA